ncbi:uncharacterized protein LOC131947761 [Physella acuta]|uniref:uncharacterized protein LOC131947761 n=1 Tax=Physella acuta TaxID=109671 RepID=UPI0027DD11AA|nr:uncharacterized protein LOC131947761 [Physella acuta]
MLANVIVTIVFCFIIAPEINADRSKLLEHLQSKSWPWFGENCVKMCGNQPTPYKPCFNLRPGKVESVLERAGIPTSVNLKTDLTVIFESPQEPVDVCGKQLSTSAVKFKLNENGRAVPKRLKLGAEIYRSRPSLDWSIETGVNYTLLFWDVGLLRVRGYWSKIQKVNSTISGKRNILYAPPANPSRTVNPILIIVMKEQDEFDEKLITKKCSKRVASEEGGEECREAVTALIKDGQNIVGLQIFYTDGSSLYEQYRACIEGYICSTSCVSKFKEYARLEKQNIKFLNLDPESIDMYANIRYYSMYNAQVNKGSCNRISQNAPIFEFRPRPGDNYEVDKSYKVGNMFFWRYFLLDVEFSGDDTSLTDTSTLYAILLVSPDGHINAGDYGNQPQGCLFYANMQLPFNASAPMQSYKIMEYTKVQQIRVNKVHYYILLFSHTQRITENPLCNGRGDMVCQNSGT